MNDSLQREKVIQNLTLMNELKQATRDYMKQKEIEEYDTPILTSFCDDPYNQVFSFHWRRKK